MEKLLNIDELAESLGVSETTIYSWTSIKKMPHIKLSSQTVKFRESKKLIWMGAKAVDESRKYNHCDNFGSQVWDGL